MPEEEIDTNLAPLVKVLNNLPCVTIICCCGGHLGEHLALLTDDFLDYYVTTTVPFMFGWMLQW